MNPEESKSPIILIKHELRNHNLHALRSTSKLLTVLVDTIIVNYNTSNILINVDITKIK